MRLDADTVKALIVALNFVPQDGKSGIYYKVYTSHGGYTIFVDFNREKFIYNADTNPKKSNITVWGKETSNFSQAENLVILECVNRLLEKGYAPSSIELEKVYPSGRGHSGRLDILVKAVNGTPFLMIECKTWGSEYEKERLKMAQNGGQLFNYYCDARATRHLCLYTSRMEAAIEYRNSIVDVEDAWAGLSEVKDIYGHWNKNFKDNGIFDGCSAPYDIRHRALTYGELKGLGGEDSGKIYNQIMEILRHNAISDKPNAFNKLLNLFVCKIVDEDKNADDELDFQWRESDTDETLQLRLNDLYKEGMWRFLEIQVIDYSQDDVAHRLANLDSTTKQWVMEMYTNTRLKKSPNFAFVEVQDERTFAHNAKVVREIVELLQVYKFRYAQRHEFLGNFFELLLNTSIKQEAGQYFTPVPISAFVAAAYSGLSLADYISIFSGHPTEQAKTHELYLNYKREFEEDFIDKAVSTEKEKLLCFLLTHDQEVVLVKAGKGKEQKQFLGYEFSKSRGREGLHWLSGGTKLYDESDPLNPEKVNSYIYRAYLNQRAPVAPELSRYVSYVPLSSLIEYGTSKFDKVINPGKRRELLHSVYPQKELGELCEIKIGGTPSRDVPEYFSGSNLWVSVSELNGGVITDTKEKITDEAVRNSNVKLIPKGTTLVSFKLSLGKTAVAGRDLYTNEAIAALIPKDGSALLGRYLFYLFDGKLIDLDNLKGNNVFGKSLNSEHMRRNVRIPLPPLDIQQKIVDEMAQIEKKMAQAEQDLGSCRSSIVHLVNGVAAPQEKPLSQIAICNPSKSALSDMPDTMAVSFVEMAAVSNDGHITGAVDRLLGDVRKGSYTYFRENDIIVAKITPCMENGKCALAVGLTNGIGMGSSEFHVFRCGDLVLPGYLFAFLNRASVREAAEAVMTGASGHRRVPIEFYRQLSIPLPPISEQRRIVAEIQQVEDQISLLNGQLNMLRMEKDAVLKKYL